MAERQKELQKIIDDARAKADELRKELATLKPTTPKGQAEQERQDNLASDPAAIVEAKRARARRVAELPAFILAEEITTAEARADLLRLLGEKQRPDIEAAAAALRQAEEDLKAAEEKVRIAKQARCLFSDFKGSEVKARSLVSDLRERYQQQVNFLGRQAA